MRAQRVRLGAPVAFIAFLAAVEAVATLLPADARARRSPNIILILADDLGYGDLGSYGQRAIRTPNLDRMAAEGVRFTQHYAGSTVCAPSRCALMTGYHTGHCTVRGNDPPFVPLRPQDVTVAEVLKTVGYRTAVIGKWGLGEADTSGVPSQQGFDEWFGYLNQAHAHDSFPRRLWRNDDCVHLPPGSFSHDLFTAEALDFIRREKEVPFFLYLAYTIPHANSRGRRMDSPTEEPYAFESWPEAQRKLAALITRMDRDVGRVLDLLRELSLERDTVVFFSSDNGPHEEGGVDPGFFHSSGPLRGIKRDLYEGGIRVPMIVRWPGTIDAGRVSDQVWASWDFLPTAAELAGAAGPRGIDGISMAPALLGKQPPDHEYLYWEFGEGSFKQAVRLGDWKGVRLGPGLPIEVYDLKNDLGETSDLARRRPELTARMEAVFKAARTESPFWPALGRPSE